MTKEIEEVLRKVELAGCTREERILAKAYRELQAAIPGLIAPSIMELGVCRSAENRERSRADKAESKLAEMTTVGCQTGKCVHVLEAVARTWSEVERWCREQSRMVKCGVAGYTDGMATGYSLVQNYAEARAAEARGGVK